MCLRRFSIELASSLAHEVLQPITSTVIIPKTCMRWFQRDEPDLFEACAAAARMVKGGTLAGEIIERIHSQFKKDVLQREAVDVNEVIREVIDLLRSEAMRYSILVQAKLAADLPQIIRDRVQLQQVTMNLIVNSIDAMKEVDGIREPTIQSQRTESEQLQVSVSDAGIGLPSQQAEQVFNAFLLPRLTVQAWGFASANPSLSPMEAACGLPIIFRAAQRFSSLCPLPLRRSSHDRHLHRLDRAVFSFIVDQCESR